MHSQEPYRKACEELEQIVPHGHVQDVIATKAMSVMRRNSSAFINPPERMEDKKGDLKGTAVRSRAALVLWYPKG